MNGLDTQGVTDSIREITEVDGDNHRSTNRQSQLEYVLIMRVGQAPNHRLTVFGQVVKCAGKSFGHQVNPSSQQLGVVVRVGPKERPGQLAENSLRPNRAKQATFRAPE